ncbi:hypothetical protein ACIODT_03135 [Streptomyces sp. NPDC088251]
MTSSGEVSPTGGPVTNHLVRSGAGATGARGGAPVVGRWAGGATPP